MEPASVEYLTYVDWASSPFEPGTTRTRRFGPYIWKIGHVVHWHKRAVIVTVRPGFAYPGYQTRSLRVTEVGLQSIPATEWQYYVTATVLNAGNDYLFSYAWNLAVIRPVQPPFDLDRPVIGL
jgi:hypothetical protein